MKWKAQVLQKYPDINKACKDVVVRDGVRYVKISGKVRRAANGSLTVRLDHSEADITWKPGVGDTVLIDGEPLAAGDVKVGQNLRFYMPEDRSPSPTSAIRRDVTGSRALKRRPGAARVCDRRRHRQLICRR